MPDGEQTGNVLGLSITRAKSIFELSVVDHSRSRNEISNPICFDLDDFSTAEPRAK